MSTYEERRPGSRLLVRFDGDEWTHERILLWPVHRDRRHERWVIETPDGDRYHVSLLNGWPEGFRGNVVRFQSELGREALRQMVLEGCDLAWDERRRRRLPRDLGAHLGVEPRSMVDWQGDERGLDVGVLESARRRLRGKRPLTAGAREPEAAGDEDAETVLLVAELRAGGGLELGDEVAPGDADAAAGPKVIGRRSDGRTVLCDRVGLAAVEERRAQARANAGRLAASADEPAAPLPADDRGHADIRAVLRERRTLAVEWNEQGARFKEWRRAVGESSEEAQGGRELRGAGAALHLYQRFTQHGGVPKTWMSTFCREYGISQRDRTYHELNCLVTIFWLAGTFDAVNLGGPACLEVAARRVAQIAEARRVAPGQPAAQGAGRFLAGASDPFDVASPEPRAFANRAAREEADSLAAPGRGRTLAASGRVAGVIEDVAAALVARGGQIYPLPQLRELGADIAAPLGRRDRARVRRLANGRLASLKWLPGAERRPPSGPPSRAARRRVSELQCETQRRAQLLAASWGGPACAEDSQQRLARLLRGRGGYAQLVHATLAPFPNARLSVPDDPAGSPRVVDLLPEVEQIQLKDFESHTMRSPQEADEINARCGPVRPCMDPVLRRKRPAYIGLVKRLLKLGLARLSTARRCQVDIFFVKKKGDRQRLILDRRPANRPFRSPPGVDRVSSDGLSRNRREGFPFLDDGLGLQGHFGRPALRAAELGLTQLDGAKPGGRTLVYPLARALPMGWAWSLCFAQRASNSRRMKLLRELGVALPMTDRGPPLILGGPQALGRCAYAGNVGAFVAPKGQASAALEAAMTSFGGTGLKVHETACAARALLRRRVVSGLELEIVIGRRAFLGLVRREGLSCFRCVYRCIKRRCFERVALRSSVEQGWMPGARQSDASLAGFGLAHSQRDPRDVGRVGRVRERRRHRLGAGFARRPARGAACLKMPADSGVVASEALAPEIPEGEVARWGRGPAFEEVPAELLRADLWRTAWADQSAFGEARGFKLLEMIRQAAARWLGRGLRFSCRWIPSEFNSSDARVLARPLAAPRAAASLPRAASASWSPRRTRALSRTACGGLDRRASEGAAAPPAGLEQAASTERGRAASTLLAGAKAAAATAAAAEDDSESSRGEELPGRGPNRADARRAAARARHMAKDPIAWAE
ncbi:unnamed protein product, partial [Prorocentrum cordatum]